MRRILIGLEVFYLCAGALAAQDTAGLLARMKAMEERIQTLEAEVKALRGKPEAITVSTTPEEKSAEPLPQVAPAAAPALGGGQLPV